jgi:predicted  nucleic acid-binding Zn-ribbon protein
MPHTTICTSCSRCYEEVSEELANAPERECGSCWLARLKRDDAAAYAAAKLRLELLGIRWTEE